MKVITAITIGVYLLLAGWTPAFSADLNYFFGAISKTFQKTDDGNSDIVLHVTAKVDHATMGNHKDNILLAADHYKYLIEAFLVNDWQEVDYLANSNKFGEIFISTSRKDGQIFLIVEMQIGRDIKTEQYTAIKPPETWFKDTIADGVENVLAKSFKPTSTQPSFNRKQPVNNYYGGALVRVYEEDRFNGGNVHAVLQVLTEVNHSIDKNWRANVAFADERYRALVQAFSGWHTIDYFTNKPVHGSLKITFDPRMSGVVSWADFDIKGYKNRKKHRTARPLEEWLRDSVGGEVDTRLKEQYRLKQ